MFFRNSEASFHKRLVPDDANAIKRTDVKTYECTHEHAHVNVHLGILFGLQTCAGEIDRLGLLHTPVLSLFRVPNA